MLTPLVPGKLRTSFFEPSFRRPMRWSIASHFTNHKSTYCPRPPLAHFLQSSSPFTNRKCTPNEYSGAANWTRSPIVNPTPALLDDGPDVGNAQASQENLNDYLQHSNVEVSTWPVTVVMYMLYEYHFLLSCCSWVMGSAYQLYLSICSGSQHVEAVRTPNSDSCWSCSGCATRQARFGGASSCLWRAYRSRICSRSCASDTATDTGCNGTRIWCSQTWAPTQRCSCCLRTSSSGSPRSSQSDLAQFATTNSTRSPFAQWTARRAPKLTPLAIDCSSFVYRTPS